MPSEFELITRYFARQAGNAELGVGDDCALLRPTPGALLAVSSDMLVAGRHFFPEADPALLGHKALAVNLSDLAAMGATPRWALLALALPAVDELWLADFSRGFHALGERFGIILVGGDTTRGPLTLCVTVLGEVAARPLRRDAARVGDEIWVSGELGAAALGLAHLRGKCRLGEPEAAACLARLHAPEPRVALGRHLAGLPRVAAIDISDGLLADLGHILECSATGAELELASLPAHPALAACPDDTLARRCLLAGGDDYELCFTAPAGDHAAVLAAGVAADVRLSRVGRIVTGRELRLLDAGGAALAVKERGYDHFAE